MTTKETAAQIRKDLKAAGYDNKAVSVRMGSGGGSVQVTAKQRGVDLSRVKAIAEGYQKIDRCEYSGEILSGGNTFVFVEFSWKLKREIEQSIVDEAARLFCQIDRRRGETISAYGVNFCWPIGGQDIEFQSGYEGLFTRVWANEGALRSACAHILCRQVGFPPFAKVA